MAIRNSRNSRNDRDNHVKTAVYLAVSLAGGAIAIRRMGDVARRSQATKSL